MSLADMKVPEEELMSDILKRLTGESALPVYSNIEKFRRGKDGSYVVAEDFQETVKKRELVNAKERLRVSAPWKLIYNFFMNRGGEPTTVATLIFSSC